MLQNAFSRFRLVAFLEGCSYLLLAVTMPLKYNLGMKMPNYIVGMAHGVLFILYVVLLIQVAAQYKWGFKKIIVSFIASLLPFGTFWAAKKVYPKEG
jgi:integral membrane protein